MNIVINGKTYEVKAHQTILDVARANGLYIPSLCYHEKIGALSRCRACAVEVEGMSGLQPACSTAVTGGMVVITNSRKALESQKQVIELMLSCGIHNCADCPRYENCQLQEAAHHLGIELDMTGPTLDSPLVSWFCAPFWNEAHGIIGGDPENIDLPITRDVDNSDEFIRLDRDKCMLCGLCVEACHLAARDVIHFSGRGHHTQIIFDNDVPLGKSRCDHCGECLPVCPVGALTQKRPIEERLTSGGHA